DPAPAPAENPPTRHSLSEQSNHRKLKNSDRRNFERPIFTRTVLARNAHGNGHASFRGQRPAYYSRPHPHGLFVRRRVHGPRFRHSAGHWRGGRLGAIAALHLQHRRAGCLRAVVWHGLDPPPRPPPPPPPAP